MEKSKKKNDQIAIYGAREHNLKEVNVTIPKDALTVITGPSGSGKSSLALDILFVEGKRRYMDSLSSYARQFLGIAKKPDVDRIDGLCPAIAIEQKTVGHNPRSTVGTITEIYDYLRVLFARIGAVHCPGCLSPIQQASPDSITQIVLTAFIGNVITVAAPLVRAQKGEFTQELLKLFAQGFYRFNIDGHVYRFKSEDEIKALKLKKTVAHTIDLLIDQLEVVAEERSRLQEAIERSFQLAAGTSKIIVGDKEHLYSAHRMCMRCSLSVPEIEPRLFSFNSPLGACSGCHGLGLSQIWSFDTQDREEVSDRYLALMEEWHGDLTCRDCEGKRLNGFALAVFINNKNIYDLGVVSVKELLAFFEQLTLDETQTTIASSLIREIVSRLTFLSDVGLSYLSLNRTARTLSGGEGQRIRLATQIGSALSGVLYILDEPSIGLHQRDNDRLIQTLKKLRDQGNTVLVVEHDTDTMKQADHIIDMGPAAGRLGGQVTAVGTPDELARNAASLTGAYLSGKRAIVCPKKRRVAAGMLTLKHAKRNNLKDVTVSFPLGVLCGVSGVSGSGKSTLIMQELVDAVRKGLMRPADDSNKPFHGQEDGPTLEGIRALENMVIIDQTPIGRTPRSNPATYIGIFNEIRKLYARLPESNARGFTEGRFSFNVEQGRCAECRGEGSIKVSMHFLPDVHMVCKTCNGARYNAETLAIKYRGKSIADVLAMTAHEATEFFSAHTTIAKRLQLLCDVGLEYLALGQPSTTLSGGEAQRIKLVEELAKRGHNTLYILDEPTTGLHTSDIEKLLVVLNRLVDKGNSMVVIEHNLDVLKTVDHLIDLGPEGGDEGGVVVAQGTPQEVAQCVLSHTGRYLKPLFSQ